tara:strand:- start:1483 stop:1941 length:459 start_codon:yes stop_codon:yes gene_type:complete
MEYNICKHGDCALEGQVYGFCSDHFYNYYVKEGMRKNAKIIVDEIMVHTDLIDSPEMNAMFQTWGWKNTIEKPWQGYSCANKILEKYGYRAFFAPPRCSSCIAMGLEDCHCEEEGLDYEELRLEKIGKHASTYSIADINRIEKIEKDRLQNK